MKWKNAAGLALLLFCSANLVHADGREGGNGGAGVVENGRYMTFYTAGIYTDPEPETDKTVPHLDDLVSFISGLSCLSSYSKASILSAILPSPQHAYYAVDASKFDAQTQARILAEFNRVTNVPTNNLQLFAVTDTNARQTFLLPSFFQLSPNDQMAILFHEAYWLMNPNTTYANVVAAEASFEAVLENPNDGSDILQFIKYAGTASDQLIYAVATDHATGALQGFLDSENAFSLSDLFGKDFIDCINYSHPVGYASYPECQSYLTVQFSELESKYPRSLFLQLMDSLISPDPSQDPHIYYSSNSAGIVPVDSVDKGDVVNDAVSPADKILFETMNEAGTSPIVYMPLDYASAFDDDGSPLPAIYVDIPPNSDQ